MRIKKDWHWHTPKLIMLLNYVIRGIIIFRMNSATLLVWFLLIIKANSITATYANSTNTIDTLQNQLNQILVQFCASEIDRNKTGSAILKFGQLSNAEVSIKDVVQFYAENYDENFDNLLHFINNIPLFELQQIAYSTLIDGINSGLLKLINVLSFENFIRIKFELTDVDDDERKTYEELLSTIGNQIKKLIIVTDLNEVIKYVNNSNNSERMFELIPTIVQGIDLNNFTDMDKIFEFSMQLPKFYQIKLISKVLSEMKEKSQFKHVFHVICQITLLGNSIDRGGWTTKEICLLSNLESEIPLELKNLIGNQDQWRIESVFEDGYLFFSASTKYNKNLLYLGSTSQTWYFETVSYNSIKIRYNNNYYYLSVEYCFHNESFPTCRDRDSNDLTQFNWYLLMSDDLTYTQIKNIYTNELLIYDDIQELGNEDVRRRLALSVKCSHCDSSKWKLTNYSNTPRDLYYRCYSALRGFSPLN